MTVIPLQVIFEVTHTLLVENNCNHEYFLCLLCDLAKKNCYDTRYKLNLKGLK